MIIYRSEKDNNDSYNFYPQSHKNEREKKAQKTNEAKSLRSRLECSKNFSPRPAGRRGFVTASVQIVRNTATPSKIIHPHALAPSWQITLYSRIFFFLPPFFLAVLSRGGETREELHDEKTFCSLGSFLPPSLFCSVLPNRDTTELQSKRLMEQRREAGTLWNKK